LEANDVSRSPPVDYHPMAPVSDGIIFCPQKGRTLLALPLVGYLQKRKIFLFIAQPAPYNLTYHVPVFSFVNQLIRSILHTRAKFQCCIGLKLFAVPQWGKLITYLVFVGFQSFDKA